MNTRPPLCPSPQQPCTCTPADARVWLEVIAADALTGDNDALRELPVVVEHVLKVEAAA